jgi:hypothetical protein
VITKLELAALGKNVAATPTARLRRSCWRDGQLPPAAVGPQRPRPPGRTCSACSAWTCGSESSSLEPKPPRRRQRHTSDSIACMPFLQACTRVCVCAYISVQGCMCMRACMSACVLMPMRSSACVPARVAGRNLRWVFTAASHHPYPRARTLSTTSASVSCVRSLPSSLAGASSACSAAAARSTGKPWYLTGGLTARDTYRCTSARGKSRPAAAARGGVRAGMPGRACRPWVLATLRVSWLAPYTWQSSYTVQDPARWRVQAPYARLAVPSGTCQSALCIACR